jgi:hypothetical protein
MPNKIALSNSVPTNSPYNVCVIASAVLVTRSIPLRTGLAPKVAYRLLQFDSDLSAKA